MARPLDSSVRPARVSAVEQPYPETLEAVVAAARQCDYWMYQAEDSLGPPQETAWREFHKAFDKLRAALAKASPAAHPIRQDAGSVTDEPNTTTHAP